MSIVRRLPLPEAVIVPITCDGTGVLDDLDSDGFRKLWPCPGAECHRPAQPATITKVAA